ncbi:MAG TPA: ATP-binding protein [Chthoniobacterales bacterium]|nr:ATP-binding protein [Chthoniobacterales bacterium]
MIIDKRAGNLALKLANAGIGMRPVVFVTHSMAGLIVKSLIVGSQTLADTDRKRLVSVIRGIVFCAVPHKGSAFADAAGVLGRFFGGSQAHVNEMRANAESLDILHDEFIEWHHHHPIPIDSYAESVGLFRGRWWWRPLALGLVVPRASANPGIAGYTIHDVDDDHLSIVKPRDAKHDVCAGVLRFVERIVSVISAEGSPTTSVVLPLSVRSSESAANFDVSRIIKYAPVELVGRKEELQLLNDAWGRAVRGEANRPHVLSIVAVGGEGKTSLVSKWVTDLARNNWPGCEAAFAWSFYSQGTRENLSSSDVFIKEALSFFGDSDMAASGDGAFEKGQRLAHLIGGRRTLLVLDGLEPMQYTLTSPTPGALRDLGLAALLKGLASASNGLCIITTRYSVSDLHSYLQTSVAEERLNQLSKPAGVALLRSLGVLGTLRELESLVGDVKGHALTLNLLGNWLHTVHAGDIRRRALVKLEQADSEQQGGHAFRVMAAYGRWFESEGEPGKFAFAMLRLLGLFDRPATADCLAALLQNPAIPGLTDALVGASEAQCNAAFIRLEAASLLAVNRGSNRRLISLDAHPLVREYFSRQLRTNNPEAWRIAHRRLYEHLSQNTADKAEPTLEDLQPLYQAVAHGCNAGLQQEALERVYYDRIKRRAQGYSDKKLGAFASNLGAVACFFDQPWSRPSALVADGAQAWLLNEAAVCLRALGRLTEALTPMRVSGEMDVKVGRWNGAAISYGNLSELELTLGDVASAVVNAELSVAYADRSGELEERVTKRAVHAEALDRAGRRTEAQARFEEAERIQVQECPDYPLLHSVWGFWYCDFLMGEAERVAWQLILKLPLCSAVKDAALSCRAVAERAAQTLKLAEYSGADILSIALDRLSVGRAAICAAILEANRSDFAFGVRRSELDSAVSGLRRSGNIDDLPRGLIARAWLRSLTGARTGVDSAQSDLDEAYDIAEQGQMKLFLADIHLHRARLFLNEEFYPWLSAAGDLAAAKQLIEKYGYGRRTDELQDAEEALRRA